MTSFDWRKNIEDSLKEGLIISIEAIGILFRLKAVNVKPPKITLDAMDIMKLTSAICGGVLVKDYAVYKKWINKCGASLQLMFMLLDFSMVKIPLGSVTLRWATASSGLNM